ncbi:hypothetical protein LTR02_005682 [Friedmanniomyces endolithicus]|nr:hypothetical protein LTR94_005360 [Friedmanniomyces endolithicus]KAK0793514.1 hypothetical protein LTR59_008136 [Friedmanniomyces endolithicus]KAK0801494.1 hypothetical protein LTR38_006800 [Friedmanniomyces endolithicus]KAK0815529.1 hypothetical protein LTR75_003817 [Friedmanniomyces endolithicus]KAK0907020.1 hypothetical protein LTR02_005682 [Friedmanniomyces endolithicus]
MSATAMQDMTKPEERLSISEYGNDDKPGVAPKGGTAFDEQEMRRMGKVQELRRNFKFIGIVGFVTILQATWESTLLANSFGLVNGGQSPDASLVDSLIDTTQAPAVLFGAQLPFGF